MRKLGIEEVHNVLLGIAVEFDKICQRHGIPYYMLGGTMLGAVRHKGFIPWDNDMDFGVPRQYYEKLRVILEKELPQPYRCCTFTNSPYVFYPYYKIEDRSTRLDTAQLKGSIAEKIGINIDIFPLDSCNKDDKRVKEIIKMNDVYGRIFTQSANKGKLKNLLKSGIRLLLPISQQRFYNHIVKRVSEIPSGDCWANLFGHWEEKEIIPIQWYGQGVRYTFEGVDFSGLGEFDLYLKRLYGDYMKLPPEEKRMPHGENAYIL
jgi:lipopolysaccharide cholinephosphotransferase